MTVRVGAFVLDSDRRQVLRGDAVIHLTPKAFDLLALLVDEAPRVVRKAELHERLWPGTFVSEAALGALVKELRRALDDRDPRDTDHSHGARRRLRLRRAHRTRAGAAGTREPLDCCRRPPHRVGRRPNVIGRDPAATVLLDVPGVSRRHAQIVVDHRGAVLEDLDSKNGTRIGDALVTGATTLRDGDPIQVGPVLVIYHASASGISTQTVAGLARR